MGLPVFLFEMGSGQFSSEGPVGLWKICPLFQGKVPRSTPPISSMSGFS